MTRKAVSRCVLRGFTAASRLWFPSAALVMAGVLAQAAPVTIDVNCNGDKVGQISVDTSGTGISGGFKSSVGGPPATLAAAATACGEDHFDWYQIVTADNGRAKDKDGNPLKAPYVDPPPGGYQGTWEDNLPWYWNEYPGPGEVTSELSRQTTADTLKFGDFPNTRAGDSISFKTWLVSLNADSSFHAWHEGFSWTYVQGTGVKDITSLGAGVFPTDAEYKDLIGGFATKIPEPSTLTLLFLGSLLLLIGRVRV